MTSTNDGKDVKSNLSSGQKGKSYYIDLYKSLDVRLSGECDLRTRTQHVYEAWRRIRSLCLHSLPATHLHLLSWLQRHTARTVLQTEWQKPECQDERTGLEDALNAIIEETTVSAAARDGKLYPWELQLIQRAEWFKSIQSNPWGHPVLNELLNPRENPPTEEEITEWLKQERSELFTTRLRQLGSNKDCKEFALALASAVMDRVRASTPVVPDNLQAQEPLDKSSDELNPSSFADILTREAGFTTADWEVITDIEFVLLVKSDRAKTIELAKRTPLRDGSQLVERLNNRLEKSPHEKKLWKNGKEVATLIAHMIITRCMVIPHLSDVVRKALYLSCVSLARALDAARLRAAASSLAAPATTARHLHVMCMAVNAQCPDMKACISELFVRTITAGMNELERLKLKTERESEARSTEIVLSSWFTQLGKVLSSSARINNECLLTAFSVHPSPIMYEKIQAAPEMPKVAKDVNEPQESTSEYGSWANDSHSLTNLVKTSETLNLKHTENQANVLSTEFLAEGEALGLSPELCQDLAVLLSGPRVKTLTWDMDRDLLLQNCRSYMERTHGGTKALTTELKYLNLDPKQFQHLREEEDDENDAYYGIEKGYEHLVELDEPEAIWQDAVFTHDSDSTCSESSIYTQSARRKKASSVSSDDESNPLSVIAENKRSKRRERPHSKERSKETKPKVDKPVKEKVLKPVRIRVPKPVKEKVPKLVKIKVPKPVKEKVPKPVRIIVPKPKKEKKEQVPKEPKPVSYVVNDKVKQIRNMLKKRRENRTKVKPRCVTDSDYDSQGKSSLASLNYEENESNTVLFDGLFSMDDIDPLKKPDSLRNNELNFVNSQVLTTNTQTKASNSIYSDLMPEFFYNPVQKTQTVSNDVRNSITQFIHNRQNASNSPQRSNMPKAIIKPTQTQFHSAIISPKPIEVPEIPTLVIDKKQAELIKNMKADADAILAIKTATKSRKNITKEATIASNNPNSTVMQIINNYKTQLSLQNESKQVRNTHLQTNSSQHSRQTTTKPATLSQKAFEDFLNGINNKKVNPISTNTVIDQPTVTTLKQHEDYIDTGLNQNVIQNTQVSSKKTVKACQPRRVQVKELNTTAQKQLEYFLNRLNNEENAISANTLVQPTINTSKLHEHRINTGINQNVVQNIQVSTKKTEKAFQPIKIQAKEQNMATLQQMEEFLHKGYVSRTLPISFQQTSSPKEKVSYAHAKYENFLKELQQSINAGADVSKNTIIQEVTTPLIHSNTVAVATDLKADKIPPQSAKSLVTRKKTETAPNTFSRLSYMHKNKQYETNSKNHSNMAPSNISSSRMSFELDRILANHNITRSNEVKISRVDKVHDIKHVDLNQAKDQEVSISKGNKTIKPNVSLMQNNPVLSKTLQPTNPVKTHSAPIKLQRTTGLTEKDQLDLVSLLRQQSNLNLSKPKPSIYNVNSNNNYAAPKSSSTSTMYKNATLNKPTSVSVQTAQPNKEISKGITINAPSMKSVVQYNHDFYKEKKPIDTKVSACNPCYPTQILEQQIMDKKVENITKGLTTYATAPKIKQQSQDWESVVNALLAHKTPSRGPNALDIVLNKYPHDKPTIKQSTSSSLRHQRIIKTNTRIEENNAQVENLNATTYTAKINQNNADSKPAVNTKDQKDIDRSILKIGKAYQNQRKTVISRKLMKPCLRVTPAEVSKRPISNVTPKTFDCELANEDDPFISSILHSDYDILEELMDDDLRKEIGELSGDEDAYRKSEDLISINRPESETKKPANAFEANVSDKNPTGKSVQNVITNPKSGDLGKSHQYTITKSVIQQSQNNATCINVQQASSKEVVVNSTRISKNQEAPLSTSASNMNLTGSEYVYNQYGVKIQNIPAATASCSVIQNNYFPVANTPPTVFYTRLTGSVNQVIITSTNCAAIQSTSIHNIPESKMVSLHSEKTTSSAQHCHASITSTIETGRQVIVHSKVNESVSKPIQMDSSITKKTTPSTLYCQKPIVNINEDERKVAVQSKEHEITCNPTHNDHQLAASEISCVKSNLLTSKPNVNFAPGTKDKPLVNVISDYLIKTSAGKNENPKIRKDKDKEKPSKYMECSKPKTTRKTATKSSLVEGNQKENPTLKIGKTIKQHKKETIAVINKCIEQNKEIITKELTDFQNNETVKMDLTKIQMNKNIHIQSGADKERLKSKRLALINRQIDHRCFYPAIPMQYSSLRISKPDIHAPECEDASEKSTSKTQTSINLKQTNASSENKEFRAIWKKETPISLKPSNKNMEKKDVNEKCNKIDDTKQGSVSLKQSHHSSNEKTAKEGATVLKTKPDSLVCEKENIETSQSKSRPMHETVSVIKENKPYYEDNEVVPAQSGKVDCMMPAQTAKASTPYQTAASVKENHDLSYLEDKRENKEKDKNTVKQQLGDHKSKNASKNEMSIKKTCDGDVMFYKDKIKITELPRKPGDNPLKKFIRFTLSNGKSFKATIHGTMLVNFDTLFADPALKSVLLDLLKDENSKCTVNIKQVTQGGSNANVKTHIQEVNIQKKKPVTETVNLISDDEDENPSRTLITEFGTFHVDPTKECDNIDKHQSKLLQKCFVKLKKELLCNIRPVINILNDETNEPLDKSVETVDVIEIDDSDTDDEFKSVDINKTKPAALKENIEKTDITQLKDALLRDLGVAGIEDRIKNSDDECIEILSYTEVDRQNRCLKSTDQKLSQKCIVQLERCDKLLDKCDMGIREIENETIDNESEDAVFSEVLDCDILEETTLSRSGSFSILNDFSNYETLQPSLPSSPVMDVFETIGSLQNTYRPPTSPVMEVYDKIATLNRKLQAYLSDVNRSNNTDISSCDAEWLDPKSKIKNYARHFKYDVIESCNSNVVTTNARNNEDLTSVNEDHHFNTFQLYNVPSLRTIMLDFFGNNLIVYDLKKYYELRKSNERSQRLKRKSTGINFRSNKLIKTGLHANDMVCHMLQVTNSVEKPSIISSANKLPVISVMRDNNIGEFSTELIVENKNIPECASTNNTAKLFKNCIMPCLVDSAQNKLNERKVADLKFEILNINENVTTEVNTAEVVEEDLTKFKTIYENNITMENKQETKKPQNIELLEENQNIPECAPDMNEVSTGELCNARVKATENNNVIPVSEQNITHYITTQDKLSESHENEYLQVEIPKITKVVMTEIETALDEFSEKDISGTSKTCEARSEITEDSSLSVSEQSITNIDSTHDQKPVDSQKLDNLKKDEIPNITEVVSAETKTGLLDISGKKLFENDKNPEENGKVSEELKAIKLCYYNTDCGDIIQSKFLVDDKNIEENETSVKNKQGLDIDIDEPVQYSGIESKDTITDVALITSNCLSCDSMPELAEIQCDYEEIAPAIISPPETIEIDKQLRTEIVDELEIGPETVQNCEIAAETSDSIIDDKVLQKDISDVSIKTDNVDSENYDEPVYLNTEAVQKDTKSYCRSLLSEEENELTVIEIIEKDTDRIDKDNNELSKVLKFDCDSFENEEVNHSDNASVSCNVQATTADNLTTVVYEVGSGVMLEGIEYYDPVVGKCFVFPYIAPRTKTVDSVKALLPKTDLNTNESFLKVTIPKLTYSNENYSSTSTLHRTRHMKRKLDMRDEKNSHIKKYRKGKNIDYPKFTAASITKSAYAKEYKQLFDYYSSLKFSYSRPFHKEQIDVQKIVKQWPICGSCNQEIQQEKEYISLLFDEVKTLKSSVTDPLNQTLCDEINDEFKENEDTSEEINEINFNMGFGERSDRVIQNLEEYNVSDLSAATLSDVKPLQPFLLSAKDKYEMKTFELAKFYSKIASIHMKNKVRESFIKTTLSLECEQLSKLKKDEASILVNRDQTGLPYYLSSLDFFEPSPIETVVQVVQVGQLPVSAAAQNPVTCDPRVTHVSDASPSQCSVENSPRDDSQAIKTEYTELTTANLSLPLAQNYVQHEMNDLRETQDSLTNENIPIEKEIKSEIKIEIVPEANDDLNKSNDSEELDSLLSKEINNAEYTFLSNNTNIFHNNAGPSEHSVFNSTDKSESEHFAQEQQQNGSLPKSDQIAHAMNAAGIATSAETTNARTQALVSILSQKIRQGAVVSTHQQSISHTTCNSYTKATSINAIALQQALAQILPPALNQTGSTENKQQVPSAPQVLHIVQGKNASGNQITLVDNSQPSVISNTNSTPVLHIVQNKMTTVGPTSNGTPATQSNSFSGLSLVDTGLQQGGNQLLHIVNTGNQKNNATGQLLKRVNLLTNLTNVQGSNEQKMVQFVCKSADGKSIQLNAPHQRSMVLRLQPIESPNVQQQPTVQQKSMENHEMSPTQAAGANSTSGKDASSQQEIKSRSVYEENYAKFIQSSSTKTGSSEKSTSLPKFNQAFGKQVYQDGNQHNENNTNLTPANNSTENIESQQPENTLNLEQLGQISNPPLLIRKSPAQTSQSQPNIVQQIKQTIAPMNIQTMHGGVIYTRQIPVNIGGGQTINLITVPSTELMDDSVQKQHPDVKFVNQSEMESSIIKIVPQSQPNANTNSMTEDGNNHASGTNDNAPNTQPQPVLTQMRIKLPMLSKTPQMVSGARVVRPSFFQIQRNVIGGNNQPVYQQLVLTAAPPLGQQTIRLPQTQTARQAKVESQSPTESQMSSSTLEQLREFDMVLEQVKERSTVQPNSNSATFPKISTTSTDTTDSTSSVSTTQSETTQQVLYSIGNTQQLNVAYVNRKPVPTTPAPATFVRSPDSSGIADSPTSSSSHSQISHTVTLESAQSETPAQPKSAKSSSKSKSRPKSSSNLPSALKLNTIPPKTSTQKPLEDEQTTQRILYILAEYKEQVENSPDKDKPAPRRRTNPPSNPSGSSKRKKSSSGSRRSGGRDMSPIHGEDTSRTMGSEDSSCGTSQGDCNESCVDSHSPQDSPRKVVRKLTFEQETAAAQPRPQPQRNVIVADGQTITVARGTAGKPATAVLMPANYILPVSMMKGGQQIAIVTNRGPKLLTVGGGEGGATNALLLQRLIGPAGLKPMLARPGVRHVRLPTAALHNLQNLQAFNVTPAAPAQPPDSTASPAPAPTPPDLVDTRATDSPWTDRESDVKPERGSSPDGSEPWNITSADHDYNYEETVRTENMDRTVLDPIQDRYSPEMEAQRIFDKMFDVESKKSYIADSPRCGYDIDTPDDEKNYHQVVQKKDGSIHRQHRLTHVSAAALRHKYAILEHELRLQKSLSEECEDLGVDSPSASELFPEAELLFASSPAHDHTQDHQQHSHTPQSMLNQTIPQPDMDDQIATDQLIQREPAPERPDVDVNLGLEDVGIVTVSENGMQATIALDQEEFARSHPNTTFHSEPTEVVHQPFTITGLKARHITSTIFHANRAPTTVLMSAPQTTVISQVTPEPTPVKYNDMINMPSTHTNVNLSSVLVKDDGMTRFDHILTDSRELHLSNTASAIVHSGNATQVIKRVCYDEDKRGRYLLDEPEGVIAGDDAKMVAEDSSRDATMESMADVEDDGSSPERHTELFWESNSASERSESRRPLDYDSDSDKCCKSPSFDETNSTDSSGVGTHMRLDSVIKEARVDRSGSADGSSADDTHPPLRTYPPKRMYHNDMERSLSGKTRAGERSPESLEVRRRASGRGVVKRGCHCCNGSPAPPRPKKSRQKKPSIDFSN